MLHTQPPRYSPQLEALLDDTAASGFTLASDTTAGVLLRALAASKPGGRLLELGTGTGVGTCWLLDGMDAAARLITVDRDPQTTAIARAHLGADLRLEFLTVEAAVFLGSIVEGAYDLIFADTAQGTYELLDAALRGLAPGGFYVVDDLLPIPHAAPLEGQAERVATLVATLQARDDLYLAVLPLASGMAVATRKPPT